MSTAEQQQWWDAPNASRGVKAHTPNPNEYHYPDYRQQERMRAGVTMGVVVPRANNDGTSKGFYGGEAGVIHVDPDAPGGGAVVDLSSLDQRSYAWAFAQADYPHEVFYQVGVPGREAQAPAPLPQTAAPRSNSMAPSDAYIVPRATAEGLQEQPRALPLKEKPVRPVQRVSAIHNPAPNPPEVHAPAPLPVMPQPMAQQPMPGYPQQMPWPQMPPPFYAPQAVPPVDLSAFQQQISQLTGIVTQLAQQVAEVRQPAAVPPMESPRLRTLPRTQPSEEAMDRPPGRPPQPSASRRAAQEDDYEEEVRPIPRRRVVRDEPRQTVEAYEESQQEPGERLIVGFETLKLKFVTGPVALKPRREVYFSLPGAGKHRAKYHEVRDGGNCLALIYDTRYDDGDQYVPPDLGEQAITVSVPDLKKEFTCSSMDLHFRMGVFDVVVLIQHKATEDHYDDEDED